jgi:hypothetical protein
MQVKADLAYCERHQDATKILARNSGQPKLLGESDGRTAVERAATRATSLPPGDVVHSHRAANGVSPAARTASGRLRRLAGRPILELAACSELRRDP